MELRCGLFWLSAASAGHDQRGGGAGGKDGRQGSGAPALGGRLGVRVGCARLPGFAVRGRVAHRCAGACAVAACAVRGGVGHVVVT